MNAYDIKPVFDFNEITYHGLLCIHDHVQYMHQNDNCQKNNNNDQNNNNNDQNNNNDG